MTDKAKIISALVDKFLSWPLPKDFSPDGGITFARTVNGEERKGPWWPIGTNLFTAEQARQMLEYLLADRLTALCAEEAGVQEPVYAIRLEDTVSLTDREYGPGVFATNDCITKLYTAPPSSQSLIDAAREECARVCAEVRANSDSKERQHGAASCQGKINALIGQPLKASKVESRVLVSREVLGRVIEAIPDYQDGRNDSIVEELQKILGEGA